MDAERLASSKRGATCDLDQPLLSLLLPIRNFSQLSALAQGYLAARNFEAAQHVTLGEALPPFEPLPGWCTSVAGEDRGIVPVRMGWVGVM